MKFAITYRLTTASFYEVEAKSQTEVQRLWDRGEIKPKPEYTMDVEDDLEIMETK
jgi:hypothetical protein